MKRKEEIKIIASILKGSEQYYTFSDESEFWVFLAKKLVEHGVGVKEEK